MPKAIYKYPLRFVDTQSIKLRRGARVLSVQMQGEGMCLWAMVDPDASLMDTCVWIAGTGNPLGENFALMEYAGTVQQGRFVWHVFIDWPDGDLMAPAPVKSRVEPRPSNRRNLRP